MITGIFLKKVFVHRSPMLAAGLFFQSQYAHQAVVLLSYSLSRKIRRHWRNAEKMSGVVDLLNSLTLELQF